MKSILQDDVILMNNHCVCWDVAQMLQRYLYHIISTFTNLL
jgi:hypothetical protein